MVWRRAPGCIQRSLNISSSMVCSSPAPARARSGLFDTACIARLRMIERLRRDLGANLAGIAVILDLLDRLTTLQREVEQWRRRS